MNKFQTEKFPVVSSKGNRYRALVREGTLSDIVHVIIYERRAYLRVFYEDIEVHYKIFDEKRCQFNYIEMVKQTVEDYEELINDKNRKAKNRKEGVIKFENWNGRD